MQLQDDHCVRFTSKRDGHVPFSTKCSEQADSVSKIREAVPQFIAVGAKNLLLLTNGTTLGFPTILIPELEKDNSEIAVTLDELTWISSINLFLVPVGALLSGPISQYFGRKAVMLFSTIPFIVSWIMLYYAQTYNVLLFALGLTGFVCGLLEAPVLTYVSEVTQSHLRGMLSASAAMAVIGGIFTQMFSGSLITWRTMTLVNLAFPIVSFVALCAVPESPQWLISKGRLKEAEQSLCWLRGWTTPAHVKNEYAIIRSSVQSPDKSKTIDSRQSFWKPYLEKTFYVPFFIVNIGFVATIFGGTEILQTFAVIIFDRLKAPIDKFTAAAFLGAAQLLGTTICVISIHFLGKRKLAFTSLGSSGTCLLLAAIYGFLVDSDNVNGTTYSWVPTTLMIAASFCMHLGVRTLPWILLGEVFPLKVRSMATGVCGSLASILASIGNKSFLHMVDGVTLAGSFLIFATINFLGLIVLFFTLPETEGKTLIEIEEHFKGIHNLMDRPKGNRLAAKEKWAATNEISIEDEGKI